MTGIRMEYPDGRVASSDRDPIETINAMARADRYLGAKTHLYRNAGVYLMGQMKRARFWALLIGFWVGWVSAKGFQWLIGG